MLRSVQDLERFRVATATGRVCGRIKDIYFDDHDWSVRHLVVSIEPRQFGNKQVLVRPDQAVYFWDDQRIAQLECTPEELETAPLASSLLPVCKQYASLAMRSPWASALGKSLAGADPHLRSARAVLNYRINVAGEFGGVLAGIIFDDATWQIRYLSVEQVIDRQKLSFHILPQAVERFTWAAQRLILRELQPVVLADSALPATVPNEFAA